MEEKIYETEYGQIHYWTGQPDRNGQVSLVFLPGMIVDHRLFERQISFFKGNYNLFVWDAPGHGRSWPFQLNFSMQDQAKWLEEILTLEQFRNQILIGHSLGGYFAQYYAQHFPENVGGFVALDSGPLQREYLSCLEMGIMRSLETACLFWPWNSILLHGTRGVAVSAYGRELMYDTLLVYGGDRERFVRLTRHLIHMLADALAESRPFAFSCPVLLICGERDYVGSCRRYNRMWSEQTGLRLEWIKDAGHNVSTDAPERVNALIEELIHDVISRRTK